VCFTIGYANFPLGQRLPKDLDTFIAALLNRTLRAFVQLPQSVVRHD
jgi:hypothetical protein